MVEAPNFRELRMFHGRKRPRCVILKITSSDVGTGAPSRSVLVSWRSQPSGLVPTTSVGELNQIGEPKNPSVVHPPHSTVLRREEGKGIHIQLTDRKINLTLIHIIITFRIVVIFFCSSICLGFLAKRQHGPGWTMTPRGPGTVWFKLPYGSCGYNARGLRPP